MKTKTIANIMALVTTILLIVEIALFTNLCQQTNGVIDIHSNMALFIALGCMAGITIFSDIILGIFMAVNKHKATNNFTTTVAIGSAFISLFLIFMIFSV